MSDSRSPKLIRSYRLVFRRRWRIFRIQGWRIPLPGGIELRLLGYWLGALALIAAFGSLPVFGSALSSVPASLRLLAMPLAVAWLLCRWEVDGRPPHRALAGLLWWRLRPRELAALRRVPAPGSEFAPLGAVVAAPDLGTSSYPCGRVQGPARLLLRYPVRAEAAARVWRLHQVGSRPLHSGKVVEVPRGHKVLFGGGGR
jgi:hypothetical protein